MLQRPARLESAPAQATTDASSRHSGGDLPYGANHFRKALLIIVTYNSYDALPDVIESIRDFTEDHRGNHAIVVENSVDLRVRTSIESALASDRILVEVPPRNEGFSHGVNRGYKLAQDTWGGFDFVVLLNPDVASAGRAVCEVVNRAEHSEPGAGVWGAVLRNQGGGIDRGCARRVWNRRRFFSHLVGYPNLAKMLYSSPRSLTRHEIENNQSELAMVSGALMCIAADVFDRGLDTHLPMYLEDQEICLRCIRKGQSVRLFSDLELLHVGGASRKSATDHEHALRVMELVEAPVQCMARLQGYRLPSLRLAVFVGGMCRLAASPVVVAYNTLVRDADLRAELAWLSQQQRLAVWFMRWAINGTFHTRQVSLTDYFHEYEAA